MFAKIVLPKGKAVNGWGQLINSMSENKAQTACKYSHLQPQVEPSAVFTNGTPQVVWAWDRKSALTIWSDSLQRICQTLMLEGTQGKTEDNRTGSQPRAT